jgi:hypothetical protein
MQDGQIDKDNAGLARLDVRAPFLGLNLDATATKLLSPLIAAIDLTHVKAGLGSGG